MGFWTSGPVVGQPGRRGRRQRHHPRRRHATRESGRTSTASAGIAGLVVWLIALVGLRELSPRLRDQLMVTIRDRAFDRGPGQGPQRGRHRGRAAAPVPSAAQARHHHLRVRRVGHAAHLLHGRRLLGHLPDHRVRFLGQGRQRAGQLELGLQRHRGAGHRDHLRPLPGAQTVHGDRRGHRRGDDRGVPGAGRPPPRLLHARDHAGAPVARAGHGLHAVDGELHRDGRGPQSRPSPRPAWRSGAGSSGSWCSSRS